MTKRNPHKNKLKTAVAITLSASFAVMGAVIAIATVQKPSEPKALESADVARTTSQGTANGRAASCGEIGGSCTVSEIAQRNKPSDCWVIYKGSYYNVTSYVSRHPGGRSVFSSDTCGKDIEPFMKGIADVNGKANNHSRGAYSQLESYKVGPVSQ